MRRKGAIFVTTFLVQGVLMSQNGLSESQAERTVRGWADPIGFCQTSEEIDAVLQAEDGEASEEKENQSWIAGICAHDDHLYAGPIYQKIIPGIHAEHVILIGVAHKALKWGVRDKLILEAFDAWSGPRGEVSVSPLREALLEKMNPEKVFVSNAFHQEEHSLEALIPYLQAYHPEAKVLPILVPYMDWTRLQELATEMAKHLAQVMKNKKMQLGKHVAILISNDCVHYGDDGWGGKNFADFGVDTHGYEAAVNRDKKLIDNFLTGPIQEIRLRDFLYALVESDDVTKYRITWCGRFSVPFGLSLTSRLSQNLGLNPPVGHFLQYATSIDPGKLPVEMDGLGVTAPASMRHWVGYTAIGYK